MPVLREARRQSAGGVAPRVIAVHDQVNPFDAVALEKRPVIVGQAVRAVERRRVFVTRLPERRRVNDAFG